MVHKLAGHIRGNVVAYVALFVALGGTAVAATSLPANSVGTKQLKNGAVTGAKVAQNTLTGANINESTLGTVPNATKLGGLSSSAYQRRVATACSSGQAIQAIAATGSPTCQGFGQGTVTSVTPGTGLTNSGTSTDPILNVDSSVFQRTVSGSCSSGSAIDAINGDGTVTCQSTGSVNSVTAGTGLTSTGPSTGPTLSVDTSAVQTRVSGTCSSGSAIASVGSDGTVGCHNTFTQFMGGTGNATISGTPELPSYLAPEGLTTSPSTTYANIALGTSAAAMTAGNLSVTVGTPPGSGNTWLFQLRINNLANGDFECEITGTATSCTDTTSSISIPASATIAMEALPVNSTPTNTTVSFGWTGAS